MRTELQRLQASLIQKELASIRDLVPKALDNVQRLHSSIALRKLVTIRRLLERYNKLKAGS
jgi:hypothetical protein